MAGEISTVQSLKAVDAWIDVINANINGGVRTAFKSSRLRFTGSNTDLQRAGTTTSLPLQFPEPSLVTGNTVIDFTQGAITASTEFTHLALQGPGFFKLRPLDDPTGPDQRVYYSRDGEFRWTKLPAGSTFFQTSTNLTTQAGASVYLLVNSSGLVVCDTYYDNPGDAQALHLIVDDATGFIVGGTDVAVVGTNRVREFMEQRFAQFVQMRDFNNRQTLEFARYGSTVFEAGTGSGTETVITTTQTTILTKSLEASNASMTQSVPELSLAQKLFSALTKVLQTKQTNVDGVLNLVR